MGVSNSGSSWYNRTTQPGWMGSWGYPGTTGSSLSPTGAGKSELARCDSSEVILELLLQLLLHCKVTLPPSLTYMVSLDVTAFVEMYYLLSDPSLPPPSPLPTTALRQCLIS